MYNLVLAKYDGLRLVAESEKTYDVRAHRFFGQHRDAVEILGPI
jgi:hypothetical protein